MLTCTLSLQVEGHIKTCKYRINKGFNDELFDSLEKGVSIS